MTSLNRISSLVVYLLIGYFCYQAVDWWGVGVLTYELLTGASPFTVEGEKNNQQEISRYFPPSCLIVFSFIRIIHRASIVTSDTAPIRECGRR